MHTNYLLDFMYTHSRAVKRKKTHIYIIILQRHGYIKHPHGSKRKRCVKLNLRYSYICHLSKKKKQN